MLIPAQRIGFIYKKNAAQRGLNHVIRLLGRLSGILSDQVRPADFPQLACRQHSDRLKIFCDDSGNGRFACTGIPRKYHMPRNG
ncbi:hypothetical protein D3C73_1350170 [compost metagenome]